MRILFSILFALVTVASFSQIASYNDLGILFSRDNNRGTARFNAMSGAFGALGGDISSTDINPAGATIAQKSSLSITLNNQKNNYTTNYYGNSFNSDNNRTRISQVGGLLAFDSAFSSKWSRFAIFFNYNLENNFSKSFTAEGFSFPVFNTHDGSPSTTGQFDQNLYQFTSYESNLRRGVFNIGFSSAYEKKLFTGISLKIHDLEFSEFSYFEEENDDIDGNILFVEDINESFIQTNGVSLNLGLIYKINKNIRIGLSYETPTWYQEVIEDFYFETFMDEIPNLEIGSDLRIQQDFNLFSYQSASKITVSGAYIFGKKGLISIDYTHRTYKSINFDNEDFAFIDENLAEENDNFNTNYRNTFALKFGTEWRFDKLSVRGGASYEKDPNLVIGNNTNEDNIKSFSLGLGYNFGNSQFDVSYTNSENTEFYSIYDTGDLTLNNNTSQISATLTLNL